MTSENGNNRIVILGNILRSNNQGKLLLDIMTGDG